MFNSVDAELGNNGINNNNPTILPLGSSGGDLWIIKDTIIVVQDTSGSDFELRITSANKAIIVNDTLEFDSAFVTMGIPKSKILPDYRVDTFTSTREDMGIILDDGVGRAYYGIDGTEVALSNEYIGEVGFAVHGNFDTFDIGENISSVSSSEYYEILIRMVAEWINYFVPGFICVNGGLGAVACSSGNVCFVECREDWFACCNLTCVCYPI